MTILRTITKNIPVAAALLAGAAFLAPSAQAVTVLDDWNLNLSVVNVEGTFTGLSDATGIDHINFVGESTVTQDVVGGDALGQAFDDDGFLQFTTFSPEGGGGVGFFDLGDAGTLFLEFTDLTGTLLASGDINFDTFSGTIKLWLESDSDLDSTTGTVLELAEFEIIQPSGGSDLNFFGGAGANASIDITLQLVSVIDSSLFTDEFGNDLDEFSFTVQLVNSDSLLDPNYTPNPDNTGVDAFGNGVSIIHVQNNGQFNLARISEPSSLALLGFGMLLLGFVMRRRNGLAR